MKRLISYKVYQFRNGRHEGICGHWESPNTAIADVSNMLEITDGVTKILPTELKVKPNPPSQRGRTHRVTHTLAHLERKQPDTLFVCVIEDAEFRRRGKAADEAQDKTELERQEQFNQPIIPLSAEVSWDDMPENWKARIQKRKSGCWVWRTKGKQGPYRDVYRRMKGNIPEGAHLRHSCDNSRCVNPNHLTPGTHRQNNQDMLNRKRHWHLKYK